MDQEGPCLVVACDGSDQSLKAVKLAARLAEATGQPLKLLAIYPYAKSSSLVVAGVERGTIDAERARYGREVFDSAIPALGGLIDSPEEILLNGDPAHEILEYMHAHPDAHMVLGRRGYSMVRSLLLGSVSEKVVRHATGPVTVVGG
ncbi:universal stress protein [Marinobacter qingdaonensis]|uniref:Universal stress protein n=1 Tax=Marinobacter qingdaonensis TaxID=3108486 RepID=A0ABU5NZ26_9GAMM|nr:universal stress protein [Marinobacter sp. ASW11-75]MEA1081066.1 universal stress protein [Marinobacter sp. ASW11-75]